MPTRWPITPIQKRLVATPFIFVVIQVKRKIVITSINLVCLLETKVKQHKMEEVIKRRFPCWNIFHNYFEAYNGRIWILWTNVLKVNLLAISDQSISCCVVLRLVWRSSISVLYLAIMMLLIEGYCSLI